MTITTNNGNMEQYIGNVPDRIYDAVVSGIEKIVLESYAQYGAKPSCTIVETKTVKSLSPLIVETHYIFGGDRANGAKPVNNYSQEEIETQSSFLLKEIQPGRVQLNLIQEGKVVESLEAIEGDLEYDFMAMI